MHAADVGWKGRKEADPTRPSAWPAKAKPRGRGTHCPACGIPNLPEEDLGPLPQSILTQEAAQSATLQA